MRVAIIGAGMAGLACAERLRAGGHEVALFDKGRGPGGRMSTRRVETAAGTVAIDHGAPYFTARTPAFRALVEQWAQAGVVARWPEAGSDAWVGTPGMNAPIRALAGHHAVTWDCLITGLMRDDQGWRLLNTDDPLGPFDAVVIAIPAEQAAPLLALHDFAMVRRAVTAQTRPCWALLLAFAEPIDAAPAIIRHHGIIAAAIRNSAKPGRTGPESWVIQAASHWSACHLEDEPPAIAARLLDAFAALLDRPVSRPLPAPLVATAHRWRFAMPTDNLDGALWNPTLRLGACGDWLLSGYVELAWISGTTLGERMTVTPDSRLP